MPRQEEGVAFFLMKTIIMVFGIEIMITKGGYQIGIDHCSKSGYL